MVEWSFLRCDRRRFWDVRKVEGRDLPKFDAIFTSNCWTQVRCVFAKINQIDKMSNFISTIRINMSLVRWLVSIIKRQNSISHGQSKLVSTYYYIWFSLLLKWYHCYHKTAKRNKIFFATSNLTRKVNQNVYGML